MKLFYTDHFVLPLPEGHRFPMAKYALLRERVVQQGFAAAGCLLVPQAATDQQLCLAHDPDYVRRVAAGELTSLEIRRIGFPWSPQMVERSRRSTGATIEAARAALAEGIAVNLAGGTHHAGRDFGEGFCVFNDVAVAARVMQAEGRIARTMILDCDVHQGNGTAEIFADDASVFTFSIHGAKNFPARKFPSDLDVPLPDAIDDTGYLAALSQGLDQAFSLFHPDLVFYIAGADPYAGDRLGRLQVTKAGLLERDRLVLSCCRARGLPVVIVMGGGYARQVEDIVDIHAATIGKARSWYPVESIRP